MTANETLVKFMQLKRDVLEFPDYFSEEDADEIFGWPEWEAETICELIGYEVALDSFVSSDANVCPFCLKYDFCSVCGYGRRHGVCSGKIQDNDYYRLVKALGCSIVTYLEDVGIEIEELWERSKNA